MLRVLLTQALLEEMKITTFPVNAFKSKGQSEGSNFILNTSKSFPNHLYKLV